MPTSSETGRRRPFPDGKQFAFTILDDTDVATVDNVAPVYRLLEKLGMRTTKTVWTMACPEGSENYEGSQTLDDPGYLAFVVDLQRRGFEIASHGATMESSFRERTVHALDRFREVFGHDPKVYANHAHNRENLYWGRDRFDNPLVRTFYYLYAGLPRHHYQGHRPGSPYWWGDLCVTRTTYARNLTFTDLNVLKVNPSMPYRDPARPHINWWFSTADANSSVEFVRLLNTEALDRLEQEGGVSIVSTHFGKGYASQGCVDPAVTELLENLSRRNGWFCPVGVLLDWLRQWREEQTLPAAEWRRMQWRYVTDTVISNLRYRWARTT